MYTSANAPLCLPYTDDHTLLATEYTYVTDDHTRVTSVSMYATDEHTGSTSPLQSRSYVTSSTRTASK